MLEIEKPDDCPFCHAMAIKLESGIYIIGHDHDCWFRVGTYFATPNEVAAWNGKRGIVSKEKGKLVTQLIEHFLKQGLNVSGTELELIRRGMLENRNASDVDLMVELVKM